MASIHNDANRQTGRTTSQMQRAPQGAIFICTEGPKTYYRDLAARLKREDLQIWRPGELLGDWWRGHSFTGVVLDHAAKLTEQQRDLFIILLTRVRP